MKYFTLKKQKAPVLIRIYRAAGRVRRSMNKHLTLLTDDLISGAYESKNQRLRNLGLRFGTWFRCFHKGVLIGLESEVIRLIGTGRVDGQKLSVLYLGDESNLKYLSYSLFKDTDIERENLGRCLTSKMLDTANQLAQNYDLVVFERPIGMKAWPTTGEWFSSPRWVRMVKQLPPGTTKEQIHGLHWNHQKQNIKRVHKMGYFKKFSRDGKDFSTFYETMHVPTMKARHGAYGGIVDENYYQILTQKGFLMWICLPDGAAIAGAISIERHGVLYGVLNGFLDGDTQWLKNGALAAIYLSTFEHAVEKGIQLIDVGEVMPILSDGLYTHKKAWGFSAKISPWDVKEWLFWIPKSESPAWNWLAANPFDPSFIKYSGLQIEQTLIKANIKG